MGLELLAELGIQVWASKANRGSTLDGGGSFARGKQRSQGTQPELLGKTHLKADGEASDRNATIRQWVSKWKRRSQGGMSGGRTASHAGLRRAPAARR